MSLMFTGSGNVTSCSREAKGIGPHFLHRRTSEVRGYRLILVRYQIRAAAAQLKFARCPHLLTASLAADANPARSLLCLPRRSIREGVSLIPFAPFAEIANDLKR